jgi:hypothetical protein
MATKRQAGHGDKAMSDQYFRGPRNIVQVKRLQHESRELSVIPRDPERGRYLVSSAELPGQYYHVALQPEELSGHCTCTWARHGGINCKHVLAALREHHAEEGAISFWPSRSAASRQHRHTLEGEGLYATVRPTARRRR